MNSSEAVDALAALAQPVRLQIFRCLVVAGPDGMTPSALVEAIAVPATGLSFHLKELTRAGLVSQERQGRNLVYRAAFKKMTALLSYLTENCCQGQPCVFDSAAPCSC
jgi:DNA-binding transcriptional ArsR family regulator